MASFQFALSTQVVKRVPSRTGQDSPLPLESSSDAVNHPL
jgi:hypothetical protein